jgi:iron complex outermembrane receptor protein
MKKVPLAATGSLFALATILATSPAFAQPAPATNRPTATAENGEQEIVVTARKRQESVLKVPVIETVIPQEQIQQLQIRDLKDITRIAPGLMIGTSVLSIGQLVTIRGVGTSSTDPGIDQSVSLNVDGMSLGQGLAFSSGMFDVQQVEVLKGPQALFYGKSSPGGVIVLRTADPGDQTEFIGRAGYELEAHTTRGEAIFSTPLSSTLGVRIAGMAQWTDGYYFNKAVAALPGTGAIPTRDSREGPGLTYQIRGTLLWKPTPQFDARLKLNLVHDRYVNGENFQLVSCPDGLVPPLGVPWIGGGEDCKKDRTSRVVYYDPRNFPNILFNGIPTVDTLQRYGTLELNYRPVEHLTLTSVTAYYNLHSHSLLNTHFSTFAGPLIDAQNPRFRRTDVTEELRLNSDFTTPLNFTLGAFYQDAKVSDRVVIIGNPAYGIPNFRPLQDGLNRFKIKTYSVFGQLRYKIVPQLELAAGARWTDETRKQNPLLFPSLTDFVAAPFAPAVITPKIHSSRVSPEATITWTPTDDLTVFASYKRASKSGSFSIATPQSRKSNGQYLDNSFGDEKVQGFEGGVKGRLLDRQLTFSLAGFDYKYIGLQVGAIEPTVGAVPKIRTVNAGSGRAYGAELDLTYRPHAIEGLTLNGSLNWLHARFIELNNVPCYGGQTVALGCNQQKDLATGLFFAQDLSGTPFIRAPNWTAVFGFNYEMPVGHDWKLIFTNSNQYVGSMRTDLGLRSDYTQKAYWKFDAGITVQSPDDQFEFAVLGKNITAKHTSNNCNNANFAGGLAGGQITGGTTSGPAGIDELGCYMDPGREIWFRVTVHPRLKR